MSTVEMPNFLVELRDTDPRKSAIIEELYKSCPPVFSRNDAPATHPRTLANKDSLGVGPEGRFSNGRKVWYLRDPYFAWLAKNIKV
jgi:hypothetical protein